MNKNMIIAATATAVAGALVYFMRKRKRSTELPQHSPAHPSRHITNSFAKAKQYATNGNGATGAEE